MNYHPTEPDIRKYKFQNVRMWHEHVIGHVMKEREGWECLIGHNLLSEARAFLEANRRDCGEVPLGLLMENSVYFKLSALYVDYVNRLIPNTPHIHFHKLQEGPDGHFWVIEDYIGWDKDSRVFFVLGRDLHPKGHGEYKIRSALRIVSTDDKRFDVYCDCKARKKRICQQILASVRHDP